MPLRIPMIGTVYLNSEKAISMWLFCLVCTIGLFLLLAIFIHFYRDTRPKVTLSDDGIYLRSKGTIAWDNIAAVNLASYHDQKFIGIILKNPEEAYRTWPRWQRYIDEINYKFCGVHASIANINIPDKDALVIIKAYQEEHRLNKYIARHKNNTPS